MDSMSLFSVLMVSLPESIINVILGFLLTGEKEKIKPTKKNFITLAITVVLFVSGSYFIRLLSPEGSIGMLISIPAHMLLSLIVLKYVYKISFGKSAIATIVFMGVLITLEIFIVPPIVFYLQKNVSTIYSDDVQRLICTLPERFLQICIIASVWNLKGCLVDYKKYKKFRYIFSSILVLLYTGEMVMLFTFMSTIDRIGVKAAIGNIISFMEFVTVNALIFVLITILTSTIEEREQEKLSVHTKRLREISKIINS